MTGRCGIYTYTQIYRRERECAREKTREKNNIPAHPTPKPTHPQRPPISRIPPEAPPAEHQVRRKGVSGSEGREEEEGCHAEVVEELEGEDLGEDAERGEGGWG